MRRRVAQLGVERPLAAARNEIAGYELSRAPEGRFGGVGDGVGKDVRRARQLECCDARDFAAELGCAGVGGLVVEFDYGDALDWTGRAIRC